jgi:hypothetical protein
MLFPIPFLLLPCRGLQSIPLLHSTTIRAGCVELVLDIVQQPGAHAAADEDMGDDQHKLPASDGSNLDGITDLADAAAKVASRQAQHSGSGDDTARGLLHPGALAAVLSAVAKHQQQHDPANPGEHGQPSHGDRVSAQVSQSDSVHHSLHVIRMAACHHQIALLCIAPGKRPASVMHPPYKRREGVFALSCRMLGVTSCFHASHV